MQARIQSLQATLASDSSQHASAYSQLQQQHEQLQQEREAATHKGDHLTAFLCWCLSCYAGQHPTSASITLHAVEAMSFADVETLSPEVPTALHILA